MKTLPGMTPDVEFGLGTRSAPMGEARRRGRLARLPRLGTKKVTVNGEWKGRRQYFQYGQITWSPARGPDDDLNGRIITANATLADTAISGVTHTGTVNLTVTR